MLVDIDLSRLPDPDGIARIFAQMDGIEKPVQVGTGLYETHLNWNHEIETLIVNEYPFSDIHALQQMSDEDRRAHWMDETLPPDYGVCDYPEQVAEKYQRVLTDPRPFVISFTPMVKSEQSSWGGWRWHKWGTYIGDQEPTTEYLYDEPLIEKVYVFHIYEVQP